MAIKDTLKFYCCTLQGLLRLKLIIGLILGILIMLAANSVLHTIRAKPPYAPGNSSPSEALHRLVLMAAVTAAATEHTRQRVQRLRHVVVPLSALSSRDLRQYLLGEGHHQEPRE